MLELGAQPVSVIARHVGIPRPTMYLVIENLQKAQLVETFKRADILYVKAISAKSIAEVLHAKEREIKQSLQVLEETLPELEALENKLSITPSVQFFEGKKAVMKMYESVFNEKIFVTFFNPQLVKKVMPQYYYGIAENIRANKILAKELLVAVPEAKEYQKLFKSKNHQIKLLPKGVRFASDTIICPDKIYMISYGEKDVSAVEILNQPLAETQCVLFEELWRKIQ